MQRRSPSARATSKDTPPLRNKLGPTQAPKPATGQSEDGGAALVGHRVVLDGIQARPELNGRKGVVLQYMSAKGRCAVRLDGEAEGSAPLSLKPVCLTRAE